MADALNTVGVNLLVVVIGLVMEYFIVQPIVGTKGRPTARPGMQLSATVAAAFALLLSLGLLMYAVLDVHEVSLGAQAADGLGLGFRAILALMLLLYASVVSVYVLYRTCSASFIRLNRSKQLKEDAAPDPWRSPWAGISTERENAQLERWKAAERSRRLDGRIDASELTGAALVASLWTMSLAVPLVVVWLLTTFLDSTNLSLILVLFAGLPLFTFFYTQSFSRIHEQCLVYISSTYYPSEFLNRDAMARGVLLTGILLFPLLLLVLYGVAGIRSALGLLLADIGIAFGAVPLLWLGLLFLSYQVARFVVYLLPSSHSVQ